MSTASHAGVDGESGGEPDPRSWQALPGWPWRYRSAPPLSVRLQCPAGRYAAGSAANAWSRTDAVGGGSTRSRPRQQPAGLRPSPGRRDPAVREPPATGDGRRTLPRRRRLGFVVGMVDDQGGVHIDIQRPAMVGGPRSPRCVARVPLLGRREPCRCAASMRRIDQPPHRRRSGSGSGTRARGRRTRRLCRCSPPHQLNAATDRRTPLGTHDPRRQPTRS